MLKSIDGNGNAPKPGGRLVSGNLEEQTMNIVTQQTLIPKIRDYFKSQPVVRAWLFGSFSRGEETEDSDVDILVDFDREVRIGLFKFAGIYADLKELLGREVDLVKNGTLKPFAADSVEHDKILIYERDD